jgi:hypothetical protein
LAQWQVTGFNNRRDHSRQVRRDGLHFCASRSLGKLDEASMCDLARGAQISARWLGRARLRSGSEERRAAWPTGFSAHWHGLHKFGKVWHTA